MMECRSPRDRAAIPWPSVCQLERSLLAGNSPFVLLPQAVRKNCSAQGRRRCASELLLERPSLLRESRMGLPTLLPQIDSSIFISNEFTSIIEGHSQLEMYSRLQQEQQPCLQIEMSILRSQDMELFELAIPTHNVHQVVAAIAMTEAVHIVTKPGPQLNSFTSKFKTIQNSLAKVRFFQQLVQEEGLSLTGTKAHVKYQNEYEVYQQLQQLSNYYSRLKYHIEEIKQKLRKCDQNAAYLALSQHLPKNLFSQKNDFGIKFMVGVCEQTDSLKLAKSVFRASRGNAVINFFSISDLIRRQATGSFVTVLLTGDGIANKVMKILEGQGVVLLDMAPPDSISPNQLTLQRLQLQQLLHTSQQQRVLHLRKLAETEFGQSRLYIMKAALLRQLKVHEAICKFTEQKGFLLAFVWVPTDKTAEVLAVIGQLNKTKNGEGCFIKKAKDNLLSPPSYFPANQFLNVPRLIVQTYGLPRYKEISPAVFTSITFPFLFGVMFGDIGHGAILLAFGLALIFNHQKMTTLKWLVSARYFIALMGFFALFCGLIYNDFLSLSVGLFETCQKCVYPVGMHPQWKKAENQLAFVNSLKMKLSVILGAGHMMLGLAIKAANALYSRDKIVFLCQFVPQMVFLICIVGYMDFLVVLKWLTHWHHSASAPSIITTMINLPLKLGKTGSSIGATPMWGDVGDTSQDYLQMALLLVAIICIPVMLCARPYLQTTSSQDHQRLGEESQIFEVQLEKRESGQIWVSQAIQTIEFVLGCISNTASYLRLWALSLAHSQLSQVFMDKTLGIGLTTKNWAVGAVVLVLLYPLFSGLTFGVLLCIDTMECFLHALRLHWVQFQSKFYKGDGTRFQPISLCLQEID